MADQPRYEPLEASRFFADGRSIREPVAGTVARGHSVADTHLFTGLKAGVERSAEPTLDRRADYADTFPFPVSRDVMRRGRERYDIQCAACHGRAGTGAGPVVAAGYPRAEAFHTDRLRLAPVGYLFDVVSRGTKRMPAFAGRIEANDRWAILAYLRALQLSQHAALKDLPPDVRQRFADATK